MIREDTINEDYSINPRPIVYIAGKLSDMAVKYLKNVSNMMEEAEKVKELGMVPIIPALDLLQGIKFGYDHYGDYFNMNIQILTRCDAVYLCPGWETSKGTLKEIRVAKHYDIPVIDDLYVLADWCREEMKDEYTYEYTLAGPYGTEALDDDEEDVQGGDNYFTENIDFTGV